MIWDFYMFYGGRNLGLIGFGQKFKFRCFGRCCGTGFGVEVAQGAAHPRKMTNDFSVAHGSMENS
jgi:hypothetical protein